MFYDFMWRKSFAPGNCWPGVGGGGGGGEEGGNADCILKNLEIYTAPDQHFKIQMLNLRMSWENLCPNLSFTVENKMGNSRKRR